MRAKRLMPFLLPLLLAACRPGFGPHADSQEPKDLIVGHWTGHYVNPSAADGRAVPSMEFEFEFRADGTFRMGKRKVWVEGKYRFLGPRTFDVDIRWIDAGPYEIVEATPDRLVYERKLDGGRTQRTELTRQP